MLSGHSSIDSTGAYRQTERGEFSHRGETGTASIERNDRGRGPRLLLVEDYEEIAAVLARLMRRNGYSVFIACSITEAKAMLAEGPFDAMVSDIGLPDGTGWELMEHVRARYGLRGIALSGQCSDEDVETSLAAGFDEHMRKPTSWRTLEAAIQRIVQQSWLNAEECR